MRQVSSYLRAPLTGTMFTYGEVNDHGAPLLLVNQFLAQALVEGRLLLDIEDEFQVKVATELNYLLRDFAGKPYTSPKAFDQLFGSFLQSLTKPNDVEASQFARYWYYRFYSQQSARLIRLLRDVLERCIPQGQLYKIGINMGVPLSGSDPDVGTGDPYADSPHNRGAGYLTYLMGMDPIDHADQRSMTWWRFEERDDANTLSDNYLWMNLDWKNFDPQQFLFSTQQVISAYAAYCAALISMSDLPVGFHVKPFAFTSRLDYKVLALASRGVKYFTYYAYGPGAVGADHFDNDGEFTLDKMQQISNANDWLAKTEPYIYFAKRAPAEITILIPQTEAIWRNTRASLADLQGVFYAYLHGHFEVDLIFEEEIARGRLLNTVKVVYANVETLTSAAFDALKVWVEGGGTLLVGPDFLACDEYDVLRPQRLEWYGISRVLDEVAGGSFVDGILVTSSEIRKSFEILPAAAARLGYNPPLMPFPLETAVVECPRGRGRVITFGFYVGLKYQRGHVYSKMNEGRPFPRLFPTGYTSGVRTLLAQIASECSVSRATWIDGEHPYVEVARMYNGRQGNVILWNYSNDGIDELVVKIREPVGQVRALKGQVRQVTRNGSDVAVTLALDDLEVLVWD